jgi:hypothetical protein
MGWRDLIPTGEETICLPWIGGRSLRSHDRTWHIKGAFPRDHWWYEFTLDGRTATFKKPVDPHGMRLGFYNKGYAVGDRFIAGDSRVDPNPLKVVEQSERVHFIEEGLDRFAVISVGRIFSGGPLIYRGQEFPEGPEAEVLDAYLDQKPSVDDIKEVTPALDAAFRMETWQREEAERRRQELESLRREEEERLAKEARRQELVEKLGDGAGRREMAAIDFNEAARAALAIGGAELLDVRNSPRGEKVVRYRLDRRRYECICDDKMRIIDSGICLQDHETGEKGDTYFTLESLPAVIRQADRGGRLVVYRHV